MVVQCPGCNTKYNLPADQVTDESTQLRCSRCGAMFDLTKGQQPPPTAGPGDGDDEPPTVREEPVAGPGDEPVTVREAGPGEVVGDDEPPTVRDDGADRSAKAAVFVMPSPKTLRKKRTDHTRPSPYVVPMPSAGKAKASVGAEADEKQKTASTKPVLEPKVRQDQAQPTAEEKAQPAPEDPPREQPQPAPEEKKPDGQQTPPREQPQPAPEEKKPDGQQTPPREQPQPAPEEKKSGDQRPPEEETPPGAKKVTLDRASSPDVLAAQAAEAAQQAVEAAAAAKAAATAEEAAKLAAQAAEAAAVAMEAAELAKSQAGQGGQQAPPAPRPLHDDKELPGGDSQRVAGPTVTYAASRSADPDMTPEILDPSMIEFVEGQAPPPPPDGAGLKADLAKPPSFPTTPETTARVVVCPELEAEHRRLEQARSSPPIEQDEPHTKPLARVEPALVEPVSAVISPLGSGDGDSASLASDEMSAPSESRTMGRVVAIALVVVALFVAFVLVQNDFAFSDPPTMLARAFSGGQADQNVGGMETQIVRPEIIQAEDRGQVLMVIGQAFNPTLGTKRNVEVEALVKDSSGTTIARRRAPCGRIFTPEEAGALTPAEVAAHYANLARELRPVRPQATIGCAVVFESFPPAFSTATHSVELRVTRADNVVEGQR